MINVTKCKRCHGIGHLSGDNCPDCDGLGREVDSALQRFVDAIKAAKRDMHGGKVLVAVADAEDVLARVRGVIS